MSYQNDFKNEFRFLWTIENFSYCWQKKSERIASPPFVVDALDDSEWKLWLCPRGDKDGNYIACFLYRENDSSGPDNIEIEYELAFLAADGAVLVSKGLKRVFNKGIYRGFDLEKRQVVFSAKKDEFLPRDTLTVRCRLWRNDRRRVETTQFFARTVIKVDRRFLLDYRKLQWPSTTPG
ncbi:hypothetical protein CEXT_624011 [Caerostris extrusa]|uniref:MATH domain-containing protein n=1 Tax=Caerostris extrusa TaxID=172846 RepID=A0AAV4RGZ3_CAEEX|nr:hypothetical protein CEXT_624011 [Caerostris extrusa]